MHEQMQHVPALIQSVAPLFNKYGYWAVGGLVLLEDFGTPFVPGETVMVAAAFFAGLGDLNIFAVAIVAFIGAVIGDNIGFAIGEYGGHPLVEKFGKYIFLTPERLHKTELFFNRHGGKVVTIARFIDGLRQVNGIIAGLSEMRWPKFITFNALGAALWVGLWTTIGYFGGNHINTFLRYQLYFTILTLGATAIIVIVKYIRKRQRRLQSS